MNKKEVILVMFDLIDINENDKVYGHSIFATTYDKGPSALSLFRFKDNNVCSVRDVKCNSKADWELLVKPYMEQ